MVYTNSIGTIPTFTAIYIYPVAGFEIEWKDLFLVSFVRFQFSLSLHSPYNDNISN